MILNLLLLQLIIVFIIDISGFVDTMKTKLAKLLTKGKFKSSDYRLRPFDCSLCAMFWTGLIFLLITHQFTLPYIAFVCLLSATTTITKDIYFTVVDVVIKILQKINEL